MTDTAHSEPIEGARMNKHSPGRPGNRFHAEERPDHLDEMERGVLVFLPIGLSLVIGAIVGLIWSGVAQWNG